MSAGGRTRTGSGSISRSHLVDMDDYKSQKAPWGLKWRSHTLFILTTIGVGIFTDLFLYGLVVPILPFMLRDRVHVPEPEIQSRIDQMLAMYAGGSVLCSPISGFVADRLPSRQLPFLVGLFALFASTLLLDVGETLVILYIARFLQGVSAAVVWTVGLSLTVETVGPERLGTAIGTMFTFVGAGSLLAPTIGGFLYVNTGYQGVFGLAAALLVIDFVMRLILIEKRTAAKYVNTEAIEDSSDAAPQQDSDTERLSAPNLAATEDTPLLTTEDLSAYKIRKQPSDFMKRHPFFYCLTDRSLLASYYVAFIQAVFVGAFDATVPKFSEELFGFNSLEAGLLFIPIGVVDTLLGPISGIAVDKYGAGIVSTIGYAYLTPCFILLRLVDENTTDKLIFYCVMLGVIGVGTGLIGPPSIVEGGAVVQRYYKANPEFFDHRPPYAQLYGLNSGLFMLGLTIGPLIGGGLKDWIGYGNMNAVIGAISFVTMIVSFIWLSKRPEIPDDQSHDETDRLITPGA